MGKYSFRRRYMGTYVGTHHYGCYSGSPIFRIEHVGIDMGFPYIQEIKGKLINMYVMNIFDTTKFKQEKHSMYYKSSNGAFVIFDLTNPISFKNVRWWIEDILKSLDKRRVPITIIGNKADLCEDIPNPVKKKEIDIFVDELKNEFFNEPFPMQYQEISCKTGEGVLDAFENLVTTCLNWIEAGKKERKSVY